MFDFFQFSGNMPRLIQFLDKIVSGFTIAESHIFNILIDISSYPCALLGSRALITLVISLFSNLIEDILEFFFFNCYLAVLRPTLCHSHGDSLTDSMLITAFVHVQPEGHQEPHLS